MSEIKWIPEIMYEENEEGTSSSIPFIMVPKNETMPNWIYIFESRETGDYEPGPSGESLPIIEMDLHQYADLAILKNTSCNTHYEHEDIYGNTHTLKYNMKSERHMEICCKINIYTFVLC